MGRQAFELFASEPLDELMVLKNRDRCQSQLPLLRG
jgi:hypothetical protein